MLRMFARAANGRRERKNKPKQAALQRTRKPGIEDSSMLTRKISWTVLPASPSVGTRSVSSSVTSEGSTSSTDANSSTESNVMPQHEQTTKHSVRFANSVTMRRVVAKSMEEAADCWYDQSELEEMKHEIEFVASLHASQTLVVDDNKYPKRGLEHWLSSESDESHEESIRAVLNEQHLCSNSKRFKKPHRKQSRIATAYTMLTQVSAMNARLRAMSDRLEVEMATQNDEVATHARRSSPAWPVVLLPAMVCLLLCLFVAQTNV